MILTIVITTLLGLLIGAAAFVAGCVYWNINYAEDYQNVCITDSAKKLLQRKNSNLTVGTSTRNHNNLIFWVHNNGKSAKDEPLIIYNPDEPTIEILG